MPRLAVFEKTRAAISKAKEHLAVAEILAQSGYFDQAYFHTAVALEEAAVAGIRLVTESGIIEWKNPPPWFSLQESGLTGAGAHALRLKLGLVFTTSFTVLASRNVPDLPEDATAIRAALLARTSGLGSEVLRLLEDPSIAAVLLHGQRRKEAAQYSTSKDDRPVIPPDEAEYNALRNAVRPLVDHLGQLQFPSEAELAKLVPLMAAVFRGDAGAYDRELAHRMKETLGDPPQI